MTEGLDFITEQALHLATIKIIQVNVENSSWDRGKCVSLFENYPGINLSRDEIIYQLINPGITPRIEMIRKFIRPLFGFGIAEECTQRLRDYIDSEGKQDPIIQYLNVLTGIQPFSSLEDIITDNPNFIDPIELNSYLQEISYHLLKANCDIYFFESLVGLDTEESKAEQSKIHSERQKAYLLLRNSLKRIAKLRQDFFSNFRYAELIKIYGHNTHETMKYFKKSRAILNSLDKMDSNQALGILEYFLSPYFINEQIKDPNYQKIICSVIDKGLVDNPNNLLLLLTKATIFHKTDSSQIVKEFLSQLNLSLSEEDFESSLMRLRETKNSVYQLKFPLPFSTEEDRLILKSYIFSDRLIKEYEILKTLGGLEGEQKGSLFPTTKVLGSLNISGKPFLVQYYGFKKLFADLFVKENSSETNPNFDSFLELTKSIRMATLEETAKVLAIFHYHKCLRTQITLIKDFVPESEISDRFFRGIKTSPLTESNLLFLKCFRNFWEDQKQRDSQLTSVVIHGDLTPYNLALPSFNNSNKNNFVSEYYGMQWFKHFIGMFDFEKTAIGNPAKDLSSLLSFPIFTDDEEEHFINNYIFYSTTIRDFRQDNFEPLTSQKEDVTINLEDFLEREGSRYDVSSFFREFSQFQNITLERYLLANITDDSKKELETIFDKYHHRLQYRKFIPIDVNYKTLLRESLQNYKILSGIGYFNASTKYSHIYHFARPILERTFSQMEALNLHELKRSFIDCIQQGENERMKEALSSVRL